jgi:hypothetical protein
VGLLVSLVVLLLSMAAAVRSWAAFATRPAVVRVLNLGLGGGFTGMFVRVGWWDDGMVVLSEDKGVRCRTKGDWY